MWAKWQNKVFFNSIQFHCPMEKLCITVLYMYIVQCTYSGSLLVLFQPLTTFFPSNKISD